MITEPQLNDLCQKLGAVASSCESPSERDAIIRAIAHLNQMYAKLTHPQSLFEDLGPLKRPWSVSYSSSGDPTNG